MPQASCCFLHVFGFRNPLKEIFSEWAENPRRSVFTRNEDRDRRGPGGGPGVTQRGTRRGPTLGHASWAPGRPGHHLSSPLRLFNPFNPKKFGDGVIFHQNHKEALSPRKSNLRLLQPCSGTLPEGEVIAGGLFIIMTASTTMRE